MQYQESRLESHQETSLDLRAVIFDYGMVLSAPAEPVAHRRLIALTGLTPDVFETHYWANRDAFDIGLLDGPAYWQKLATDAGIELSPTTIGELIKTDTRMWMDLNQPMVDWLPRLRKADLRIGILSNIGHTLVPEMLSQFTWLAGLDHCTWSCHLGLVKPDPAIYRHTLQKLGVKAHQALFIDDKPVNIRAAEELGMHGLVFTDLPQMVVELRARGFDKVMPMPVMEVA